MHSINCSWRDSVKISERGEAFKVHREAPGAAVQDGEHWEEEHPANNTELLASTCLHDLVAQQLTQTVAHWDAAVQQLSPPCRACCYNNTGHRASAPPPAQADIRWQWVDGWTK